MGNSDETSQKNPLISVIIPVYNVQEYLTECIQSVMDQTYKNLEILLIDDGSTDNSSKICDELKGIDNRIVVIHQENAGLSAARNVGVAASLGEFIMFVDSDDYIHPNMVQILYDLIIDSECDISSCDATSSQEELGEGKGKISVYKAKEAIIRVFNDTQVAVAAPMKLYKAAIIKDIEFEIGRINEDYVYTIKVLTCINRLAYADLKLYFYRINPDSITHKKFTEKNLDLLYAANQVEKIIKNYNRKLTKYEKIKRCYIAVTLYTNCVRGKKQLEYGKEIRKEVKKNYWKFLFSRYNLKNKLKATLIVLFPGLANKMIQKHFNNIA